jgi:hypothetical protein
MRDAISTPRELDPLDWPASIDQKAYHGLAGEILRTVEPHSEGDPVAILIQLLVAFGNVIHCKPHFVAEADRHSLKLFTVLVGESSKGRKGASWGHIKRLFGCVDPEWTAGRILNGLSTGEGLIWQVRDPSTKRNPVYEGKGKDRKIVRYEDIEIDGGVSDKRLLVVESEFCRVLKVMARDTNTLSAVIRNAWDQDRLQTLTKNEPATATGTHISMIGHITRDELCRNLTMTEAGNGFANRFLWMCVRRSKCLPEGGSLTQGDLAPLVERLRAAVTYARQVTEIRRDDEARALWASIYPALSDERHGMVGAMTSRAEAQVMRLACIYALLDQSASIRTAHLLAAQAVWDYAEASTRYIFGGKQGDPITDTILTKLKERLPEELTQTQISKLFHGHQDASKIERALQTLERDGLVTQQTAETGGRPVTWWRATEG